MESTESESLPITFTEEESPLSASSSHVNEQISDPNSHSVVDREEYARLLFVIRNMQVLKEPHRVALRKLSKNQLLQIIEIYKIIVQNINYIFS
jgi:hypothetical protein